LRSRVRGPLLCACPAPRTPFSPAAADADESSYDRC